VREVVPPALEGERLDRVLALLTGRSRSEVAGLLARGAVHVDAVVVVTGKGRVVAGQVVEIELPPEDRAGPRPDPTLPLDVRYEDESVIVVDKSPGLVVHPAGGHRDGTLVNAVLARYPEVAGVGDPARPGIVHRLDVGTSGLLVVARTPEAYVSLVDQLAGRRVRRVYLALVWGQPEAASGLIDAPVGRSLRDPLRMTVSETGRTARTRYEIVASYTRPAVVSLLRCRLETGRTHQIRVHLAAIEHPVVGDARYRGKRRGVDAPRPMLHAAELAFTHPRTGAEVSFAAEVPPDMAAVLATLA
jgi:23S rRNA pseudouridine1911/1915/1917 synthase